MARIIERTEASGVGADDYVLLCSPTLGERKFKAIDLVPSEATLIEKTIKTNGTYNAEDDEADGYSSVEIAVPAPALIEKSITENGTYTANEETDNFTVTVYNNPFPYNDTLPLNDWFVIEVPATYGMYNQIQSEVTVDGMSYLRTDNISDIATYTDGMNPTSATLYRSHGTSPEALYIAKASDNSKLYLYQSAESQTFKLKYMKVKGEKTVAGYSEVVVDVAGGSSGIKLEYLCYAKCEEEDSGVANVDIPLTIKEYDSYSDYLSYDTTTYEIEVLKDFTAIITPWVVNYQNASNPALMGVKLNGSWLISPLCSQTYNAGSVGAIQHSFVTKDRVNPPTNIPPQSNGIYISLHIGDVITVQKPYDHGWSHYYLKIYKLFDSTTSTDNFMSSVVNLWDTSTYQSVIVSDDSEIPSIVYNADDLLIANPTEYITVNFDEPLEEGESYIGALKDGDYSSFQNVPLFFTRSTGTQTINQIPLAQGVATLTITDTTASLSDYSGDYRNVWLRLSKVLPGQTY